MSPIERLVASGSIPGMVRAEGGPYEPRLIVPLTIEIDPRPEIEMIALTSLRAVLHLGAINIAQ